MKTGSLGTFVISWSQTEVDGIRAASLDMLTVGVAWRWTGSAVRVNGPQGLLLLEEAEGGANIRKRAARMVRRLVGAAVAGDAITPMDEDDSYDAMPDQGFVVTDGHRSFNVTIIPVPDTGAQLLMFVGDVPPVDQDLWVVRTAIDRMQKGRDPQTAGGVICFTPETRIATPEGARRVADLRPGHRIQTRDNGAQEILWMGHRRMTGARLYAMPHLRPIRFKANSMGLYRPDEDLVVSPQHRMLVRGGTAQALFNSHEILVAAEDLVNDHSIVVDHRSREVTYVHLLLEQHNIVFANGLETESFHPSNTALDTIDPEQRQSLLRILPEIARDPFAYGDHARRNVSTSEAAILRYEMAA